MGAPRGVQPKSAHAGGAHFPNEGLPGRLQFVNKFQPPAVAPADPRLDCTGGAEAAGVTCQLGGLAGAMRPSGLLLGCRSFSAVYFFLLSCARPSW